MVFNSTLNNTSVRPVLLLSGTVLESLLLVVLMSIPATNVGSISEQMSIKISMLVAAMVSVLSKADYLCEYHWQCVDDIIGSVLKISLAVC